MYICINVVCTVGPIIMFIGPRVCVSNTAAKVSSCTLSSNFEMLLNSVSQVKVCVLKFWFCVFTNL